MKRLIGTLFLAVLPLVASAAEPTAEALVEHYDRIMSPRTFDGLLLMVSHRQDGTTRAYEYRALKSDDKARIWFFEPASAKGQEMLRVGDNMWIYMPNLKRSLRVASRESFQGGDFSNGDILRVNYTTDYQSKLAPSEDAALWELELTAKSPETAYDRIKLWMSKKEQFPVKAEYYAASGKLLRSATFDQVKTFRGLVRPSHIVMRNELATKRYSELTMMDMKIDVETPAHRFVLDDLGR